ncbi:MAG: hypothetical protein Q8L68_04445, partial [Methylococcales bacterium]|nr:hypothetical protein [Methylococcales bacterium]
DRARQLLINTGMSGSAVSGALGPSSQGPVSASTVLDLLSQQLGGSFNNRNLTISGINNILIELGLTTGLNIRDNNGDGLIQREELFNSLNGDGNGDGNGPPTCTPSTSYGGWSTCGGTCHSYSAQTQTVYTVYSDCSTSSGTKSQSCYVSCPPSCNLSANPSTIILPQYSTLSWGCQYANTCSINQGIGSVNTAGSKQVRPPKTTTYTLSCQGIDGFGSWPATVNVGFIPWIREIIPR